MAVIRNTAAMQYRGKVGNTTYYVEGGRQLARVSQNSSNYGETASRSESQQFQRGKWGNLVNFYKVSKGWMRKAYETKKRTQSDYNRFMQLNTPTAKIYLTKNMYANGGCVVDAFRISEGSLRPIQVSSVGNVYATDLRLPEFDIDEDTTVQSFSELIIRNNSQLREGMQISFISYQQEVGASGVPSLICTAYELTLDESNRDLVRSYLPEFCSQVVDGCFGTSANISTGAFAYVLSETRNGATKVSTQTLITKNDGLINQFSTQQAIADSIASYGVDEDIFLTSGSKPTDATPQPVYLESLNFDDDEIEQVYKFGGVGPDVGAIWGKSGSKVLKVSGSFNSASSCSIVLVDDEYRVNVPILSFSAGNIKLGSISSTYYDYQILRVEVVIDGLTVHGYFRQN